MSEHFSVSQHVYCLGPRGWTTGSITNINAQQNKIDVRLDSGEQISVPTANCHGKWDGAYNPSDPDLFRVGDLHVATLLHCLKDRYEGRKEQYSRMGEMILSVNPFQVLGINSEREREKYLTQNVAHLPPHIWHISDKAYKQITVRQQRNQSVVISGESGSGKTENTKMLIAHLSTLSLRQSCTAVQKELCDAVGERLRWSNPILETFGNAKTVRNDNSSRFGKYIKLFFDTSSGVMVGGEMVTYLLEKSRIVRQGEGERNYHVFYEMLAGLNPQQKAELRLGNPQDYRSLNRGGVFTRRGVDGGTVNDAQEFQTLVTAFQKLGVSQEKYSAVFRVLAAILHLQEVNFVVDDSDKAAIQNMDELNFAASLLYVDPAGLSDCFLTKIRTKIMTVRASKPEAEVLRDAFSKALYVGIFDDVVKIVNAAIVPPGAVTGYRYVGVLDIFGFENFKKNSFEQMCINYANETLQGHYNKYTFQDDVEECNREGIPCPVVTCPDNTACISMFNDRGGLLDLIDEQTNFKLGTSETLTRKLWDSWGGKPHFIKPKSTTALEFGIRHYAHDVSYDTAEWIEKNADAVKEEAKTLVQASADPARYIKTLLDATETISPDGTGGKKRQTISTRFKKQLGSLRGELESTETNFIRCVKPNTTASAGVIENDYVGSQLESAGVLQTITLKRQGYPVRRPLDVFSKYFFSIAPNRQHTLQLIQSGSHQAACQQIYSLYQRVYGWPAEGYLAIGRTKTFMKAEVWNGLEKCLLRRNRQRLKRCMPFLAAWAQRFRVKKAEEERRRQEQLRQMQEEAANREQQAATGQQNFAAVGASSGLDDTKSQWFQEMAAVFRTFDLPVILDVVFAATSKDQALRYLADMQQQRLTATLPGGLQKLWC